MKRSTSKTPKSAKRTTAATKAKKPHKPKRPTAAKPTKVGRAAVVKKVRARAEHASSVASKRVVDLVDLVRRRMGRIVEDFYDMGVALRELATPRLYTSVGCTTFDDLLRKYALGRSQAYEAMAVVKAFPNRDEAIGLGLAKAAAILHYASATRKPDLPQLITQSGRLGGKKLADMSAHDIDAETARVRKIQHAKGPPTEREVRAARAARELQRWMRIHAGRPARVEAHEDHREAWIDVRFSLAEVERWLKLGRHLRAVS
jgi:hypothetical protein